MLTLRLSSVNNWELNCLPTYLRVNRLSWVVRNTGRDNKSNSMPRRRFASSSLYNVSRKLQPICRLSWDMEIGSTSCLRWNVPSAIPVTTNNLKHCVRDGLTEKKKKKKKQTKCFRFDKRDRISSLNRATWHLQLSWLFAQIKLGFSYSRMNFSSAFKRFRW